VQDTELYRHLLGIEKPWAVARVELAVSEQRVHVFVEHQAGEEFACPECGKKLGVYDHAEERTWRHLDSCQFATMLRARIPRVQCPEHGVRQAGVPWAEPRSRFTLLFERFAIDVLLETDVAGAAKFSASAGTRRTTSCNAPWLAGALASRVVSRDESASTRRPSPSATSTSRS
jgi:transposase